MRYTVKVLDQRGVLMKSPQCGARSTADFWACDYSRTRDLAYVWDADRQKIASIWRDGRRIDTDDVQLELPLVVAAPVPANIFPVHFSPELPTINHQQRIAP